MEEEELIKFPTTQFQAHHPSCLLISIFEERERERESKRAAMNITNLLLIFFIFSTLHQLTLSDSEPRSLIVGRFCGNATATGKKALGFVPTFVKEMEILSQSMTIHHFATISMKNTSIPVYALSQCHQDLSQTECLLCFAKCRTMLPGCLPALSARIFLDGCFLRYDTHSFFNEATDPSMDSANCTSVEGAVEEVARPEFEESVGFAVGNVTEIAVSDKGLGLGFGTVEVRGVYALAQCWSSLSTNSCRGCLEKAGKEARGCVPSRDGRGLNSGCYLRYSTTKFYNDDEELEADHGSSATGITVAVVLVASACTMLCLFAVYGLYARLVKLKQGGGGGGVHPRQLSISLDRLNLSFKYETLEKATNFFDPSRKLGQGGTGSVFKGTLPNGKIVAVKRLVFNTKQWVDDFFNEVDLISGIEHNNLVKLLGCSIEGPESLLVYEYVANKSLDHHIFDNGKKEMLKWKQRLGIIVGIAEGLAHLHGGCKVKIIHRDIKSTNVLIDDSFTAKIADFGLVRCFGADITHLSTGIAGTLGYMAPEYVVRGHLTEKADVYSFGVLVLEIVTGRRNSSMESGSLLQMVWRLYKLNRVVEAMDPRLKGDFPEQQAHDVLRIALICTQASAPLRPMMDQVVQLLSQDKPEIPEPNQPPFMSGSSSSMQPASSSSYSCSTNRSQTLSLLVKTETSYDASTESSSSRIRSWEDGHSEENV